ncbi:uroporphyrinogen-III synthase [Thiorhodococcus mannitoliphagus]|uniref:Uroporphyrinogen-III synthase n=1 Tax=Thiorhodococcus mannitoliphagus TaxID=329406 RepID=A0A6P1DUK7_9GAMM|nr:uroporphyrinogen-III synthase [Thiorhodococcus mannitoliphagus]NEX22017.1 uroporphyrinogen-III synthase [Thiorhodococcus mannitoliphagus]
MGSPCDLGGRGVLVTRPAAQAEGLCQLIEAAGGRAIRFPTIAIDPVDTPETQALLAASWDLMYFVSPNAVEQALAQYADETWPQVKWMAAVGRGTARVLQMAGRAPDLVPSDRYESEALLEMPELADMTGRRVLIVRGEGGRGVFAQAMRERGAEVYFAEVYRRVMPAVDARPLLARWSEDVDYTMATSDEVLLNLAEMLGPDGRSSLLATPLVVIAERTAKTARDLGFRLVRVAERAEDAAILRSFCALGASD